MRRASYSQLSARERVWGACAAGNAPVLDRRAGHDASVAAAP